MSWSHYAKVSFARFREQGRLYSCKTIHESFLCITTLFLVYRWSEVGWWNVSYVHIMMLAYLWVEWKVLAELEGAGVVLVVLSKLLTLHGNRKINCCHSDGEVFKSWLTSRMSILSSQRRTSGPSSFFDLAAEREREKHILYLTSFS